MYEISLELILNYGLWSRKDLGILKTMGMNDFLVIFYLESMLGSAEVFQPKHKLSCSLADQTLTEIFLKIQYPSDARYKAFHM